MSCSLLTATTSSGQRSCDRCCTASVCTEDLQQVQCQVFWSHYTCAPTSVVSLATSASNIAADLQVDQIASSKADILLPPKLTIASGILATKLICHIAVVSGNTSRLFAEGRVPGEHGETRGSVISSGPIDFTGLLQEPFSSVKGFLCILWRSSGFHVNLLSSRKSNTLKLLPIMTFLPANSTITGAS